LDDNQIIDEPISEEQPIEEAVFVDEETGDAVPVILVNEELVEQALQVRFLKYILAFMS
jgi:hypothetical protein